MEVVRELAAANKEAANKNRSRLPSLHKQLLHFSILKIYSNHLNATTRRLGKPLRRIKQLLRYYSGYAVCVILR